MNVITQDYKGFVIEITVEEEKPGEWSRSYTVKGTHIFEKLDWPLEPRLEAIASALRSAKETIDISYP